MSEYVLKNGKKLKKGYTTGTCAQAATKAAALALIFGEKVEKVQVNLPLGEQVEIEIKSLEATENSATACVKKHSGDDPDVTDGILIYSTITKDSALQPYEIVIDGGEGIGRVTKEGLNQPVGNAAINSVPRQMIAQEVVSILEEVEYETGISVIISAPEGKQIAEKTFNGRLGIEGGISILGTSGIVEPMSEKALIDTIETELRVRLAEGKKAIVVTPGNYGHAYATKELGLPEKADVTCSNYIGETIDLAVAMGVEELLLIGNAGKLIKLAAGIFQTHSKIADARMETIGVYAAMAGATQDIVTEIMDCVMTDAAFAILKKERLLESVMEKILCAIERHVTKRAGSMQIAVILYSEKFGFLGQTSLSNAILEHVRN